MTATAADALSGLALGSFKVTGTSNDPANGQIVITGAPSQFVVQLGADKDQVYTLTAKWQCPVRLSSGLHGLKTVGNVVQMLGV